MTQNMAINEITHLISTGLSWILSHIFQIIGILILIWIVWVGLKVYNKYNAVKTKTKKLLRQELLQKKLEKRREDHPKFANFSDNVNKVTKLVGEEVKEGFFKLQEKARAIEDRQRENQEMGEL